jgi:hypothetical protein
MLDNSLKNGLDLKESDFKPNKIMTMQELLSFLHGDDIEPTTNTEMELPNGFYN